MSGRDMKSLVTSEKNLPTDLPAAHALITHYAGTVNALTLKNNDLIEKNQELEQRLAWFKRQIFGPKSERYIRDERSPDQLALGETLSGPRKEVLKETTVAAHTRRTLRSVATSEDDERGLRFDATVPVEDQPPILPEEVQGKDPSAYEIIDMRVSHTLAQRPGQYYVKRYHRPVIKLKETKEILPVPALPAVLERSFADVTLLAGILEDKFLYYLPLYRQHQRLTNSGITLSRVTLTNYAHRAALLLEPIYEAQIASALMSKVLPMDETPLHVGLSKTKAQRMHQGCVWALYGELDEPTFVYAESRGKKEIQKILGQSFSGTLLSDGHPAYDAYLAALEVRLLHARCWAHARREFFEAKDYEPALCNPALEYIGKLYAIEAAIKDLSPEERLKRRDRESRPVVDEFFDYLRREQRRQVLLPSNLFLKAAAYALSAEAGLRVFLGDPAVPIDNNKLERTLRPIPMGRKNWMFCWTEVGAKVVTIAQSLVATCRVHGVRPFDYFVDVLQRLDSTPMSKVAELTPRVWAAQRNTPRADGNATGKNAPQ